MSIPQCIAGKLYALLPEITELLKSKEEYSLINPKVSQEGLEIMTVLYSLKLVLDHTHPWVFSGSMIVFAQSIGVSLSSSIIDPLGSYYDTCRGIKRNQLVYYLLQVTKAMKDYPIKYKLEVVHMYLYLAALHQEEQQGTYLPTVIPHLYPYMNVVTFNKYTLTEDHITSILIRLMDDTDRLVGACPEVSGVDNYTSIYWLLFLMEFSHMGCRIKDKELSLLLLKLQSIGCDYYRNIRGEGDEKECTTRDNRHGDNG